MNATRTSFCDSGLVMDRLYFEPQMFAVVAYLAIVIIFALLGLVHCCRFLVAAKRNYDEDIESDDDNDELDDTTGNVKFTMF